MSTLAIIHNTTFMPVNIYVEYKHRESEQFFDQLTNTIHASSFYMRREESLNGWMFINHVIMRIVYEVYLLLRTISLNKKQKLNHRYSIMDTIEYRKIIKKTRFSEDEWMLTEADRNARTLRYKMNNFIT